MTLVLTNDGLAVLVFAIFAICGTAFAIACVVMAGKED